MNHWKKWLIQEFQKPYFEVLKNFLENAYQKTNCFPKKENIFRAFSLTPLQNIKVVILGQDPYHDLNQANGLAFSVNKDCKLPPSLKNIFQELKANYPEINNKNGDLSQWAKEGVFLLNTILTVEYKNPLAHANIGWETFTDNVLQKINTLEQPIVFFLWGQKAKAKRKFLTNKHHLILESAHPSPYSAYNGFFGTKMFAKGNAFLVKNNLSPINWNTQITK